MMRFHGRTGRGGQTLPSSYLASTRQGAQVAVTLASAARHPGALCCALSRPVLHVLTVAQLLSRVGHFAAPWTATRQASLPITNSQSLLRLVSIESVMPSNHLILCHPFSSCLQSFPASGSFPMSQFFASGGQSIGISASASVLPMNIQD